MTICTNLDEGFDHLYVVLLHPPHHHLIQLQLHHVQAFLCSNSETVCSGASSTIHSVCTGTLQEHSFKEGYMERRGDAWKFDVWHWIMQITDTAVDWRTGLPTQTWCSNNGSVYFSSTHIMQYSRFRQQWASSCKLTSQQQRQMGITQDLACVTITPCSCRARHSRLFHPHVQHWSSPSSSSKGQSKAKRPCSDPYMVITECCGLPAPHTCRPPPALARAPRFPLTSCTTRLRSHRNRETHTVFISRVCCPVHAGSGRLIEWSQSTERLLAERSDSESRCTPFNVSRTFSVLRSTSFA